LEGYDSGRLIVAIPFVAKVLEQGKHSKVFRPPNPWLVGILRLLVELYHYADLKLNLKFEIEVLCNAFQIKVSDIEPTSMLKDRPPKEFMNAQAMGGPVDAMGYSYPMQSAGMNTAAMPSAAAAMGLSASQIQLLQQQQRQQQLLGDHRMLSNVAMYDEVLNANLPRLAAFLHFDPSYVHFTAQPFLKNVFQVAIDRAIRDVIAPAVERSVTIASNSARELVTKDFALEPDDEKMRKAAHIMVRRLAGSLALVTCREPLRVGIVNNVRAILLQNKYYEQLPEELIINTVDDNLNLACSVIERVAAEKAVLEVDDMLNVIIANRRKHRERTGQPYYDVNALAAARYLNNLPDTLRLKPTGLTPDQLRIYEDFGKNGYAAMTQLPTMAAQSAGGSSLFMGGGMSEHMMAMQGQSLLAQQAQMTSAQQMLLQAQQQNSYRTPSNEQQIMEHFLVSVVDDDM
jgi:CCR4-NOT transcription complex subunit 1